MSNDNKSLLNRIEGLKISVEFFASHNKICREKWVVAEFLANLSISYNETELVCGSDPPDVIFREAQFEVKEIMDEGLERHREYKETLARAKTITDTAELLEFSTPKEISIQKVFARIHSIAASHASKKYSPDVRKQLDLLFYVDLLDVIDIIETPFPDVTILSELGYRSVSFLESHHSCILCTDPSAPSFLHVQPGIIHREPRIQ
jgi:hypothetical protein